MSFALLPYVVPRLNEQKCYSLNYIRTVCAVVLFNQFLFPSFESHPVPLKYERSLKRCAPAQDIRFRHSVFLVLFMLCYSTAVSTSFGRFIRSRRFFVVFVHSSIPNSSVAHNSIYMNFTMYAIMDEIHIVYICYILCRSSLFLYFSSIHFLTIYTGNSNTWCFHLPIESIILFSFFSASKI